MTPPHPIVLARNLVAYSHIFRRSARISSPPVTVLARGRALLLWRCAGCALDGCFIGPQELACTALGGFLVRHRCCTAVAPPHTSTSHKEDQ